MARPIDPAAADSRPPVPGWCKECVPADWADPADETSQQFRDLAEQWGRQRARDLRAQSRWSDARRAWADEHGYRLAELCGRRRYVQGRGWVQR